MRKSRRMIQRHLSMKKRLFLREMIIRRIKFYKMAEHNSKKTSTKIEKEASEKPDELSQPATGLSDFIGIVLIAAGFFNVPSLLKT